MLAFYEFFLDLSWIYPDLSLIYTLIYPDLSRSWIDQDLSDDLSSECLLFGAFSRSAEFFTSRSNVRFFTFGAANDGKTMKRLF